MVGTGIVLVLLRRARISVKNDRRFLLLLLLLVSLSPNTRSAAIVSGVHIAQRSVTIRCVASNYKHKSIT